MVEQDKDEVVFVFTLTREEVQEMVGDKNAYVDEDMLDGLDSVLYNRAWSWCEDNIPTD